MNGKWSIVDNIQLENDDPIMLSDGIFYISESKVLVICRDNKSISSYKIEVEGIQKIKKVFRKTTDFMKATCSENWIYLYYTDGKCEALNIGAEGEILDNKTSYVSQITKLPYISSNGKLLLLWKNNQYAIFNLNKGNVDFLKDGETRGLYLSKNLFIVSSNDMNNFLVSSGQNNAPISTIEMEGSIIRVDEFENKYIISTSEGIYIYKANWSLERSPIRPKDYSFGKVDGGYNVWLYSDIVFFITDNQEAKRLYVVDSNYESKPLLLLSARYFKEGINAFMLNGQYYAYVFKTE